MIFIFEISDYCKIEQLMILLILYSLSKKIFLAWGKKVKFCERTITGGKLKLKLKIE